MTDSRLMVPTEQIQIPPASEGDALPPDGAPEPLPDSLAPDALDASEPPPSGRSLRLERWLAAIAALGIAGLAFWVLRRELHQTSYRQLAASVKALPHSALAGAVLLTLLSYLALAAYDALAIHYVRRRVALGRIVHAAFIAYGFVQTLGFSIVTGGAIRYRFWSGWGLSATEIAQGVAFSTLTFWLGVAAVAAVVFLAFPGAVAGAGGLPELPLMLLGAALAAGVVGYFIWNVRRTRPVAVRGYSFPVPGPRLALAQIVAPAVDWMLAGAVLYVLLPAGRPSFTAFLGIFLLGMILGLVSHVPGGLGVFEATVIFLLRRFLPVPSVVSALVAYRAIYYLLPFFAATLLLAVHETLVRQRERWQMAGRVATRWVPGVVPHVLAITVFLAGVVLLASGATPELRGRMHFLDDLLPLGVIELSHFAASLAGAALLVLAWGLRRRLDAAYGLTVLMLAVGVVASLLKGLDWEEALLLGVVLLALLPSHRHFYRRAKLLSEPLSPGWIALVVLAVGAATWLGFFSYKHVDYSNELWWRFTTYGNAPRFLRATVGVVGGLMLFAVARLLQAAPAEPTAPTEEEEARAATIASKHGRSDGMLALLGDKSLLFAEGGDGFLMYGVEGRSWVALGDPVGAPAECAELAWRFRELADRHGAWTVFYEVSPEFLPLYIDLGLTLLKIGEEARVSLPPFTMEGSGTRKTLRRTLRVIERDGGSFEVLAPPHASQVMAELRLVSDDWLETKHTREKSFSLGRFDPAYLAHFPIGIVRHQGRIVAFANLLTTERKSEVSVDLMRYSREAPREVMDYLFVQLMLWAREQGYEWFNLGMAPLAGLENRAYAPFWHRVGSLVYRHAEHFYNFGGLRTYKGKFGPVWEPRYLAAPRGLVLPRVLANLSTLISGGVRGVVAK